jgi:glycosyltransferase involved in cell wall biosynthesis
MSVVFFGKLDPTERYLDQGVSVAGCETQKKIVQELRLAVSNNSKIIAYASQTGRSWPFGPFIKRSLRKEGIRFLLTVNLPILREFIFGLQAIFLLFKTRPLYIVQYNIFPCLNISVSIYRAVSTSKSIVIVQDYAKGNGFNKIRVLSDYISGKSVKYYSKAIIVTKALGNELKVRKERLVIFPGAAEYTTPVKRTQFFSEEEDQINVVFAGALTKYNGVDKLVDNINKFPLKSKLHIFGDGPLKSLVLEYSNNNDSILFYGKKERSVVEAAISDADVNICLRYSIELDARFFFPSKFFSVNCFNGFVLVNDFPSLPEKYREIGAVFKGDFENLSELLTREDLSSITKRRQELIFSNYQWSSLFSNLLK